MSTPGDVYNLLHGVFGQRLAARKGPLKDRLLDLAAELCDLIDNSYGVDIRQEQSGSRQHLEEIQFDPRSECERLFADLQRDLQQFVERSEPMLGRDSKN